MCTGRKLLTMQLEDFKNEFGNIGEIIFTAFKQVLDVAPNYTARSSLFARKIQALIDNYQAGAGTDTSHTSSFWRTLDIRHWSKPEVMSWVYNVAEEYNMSADVVSHIGELFGDVPGNKLHTMSLEEFRSMDESHGDILCRSLELIKIQESQVEKLQYRPQGAMAAIDEKSSEREGSSHLHIKH